MNVSKPNGTTVTYSADGKNYGSDNPSFTNVGTYTVYYRIMKNNYDTIEASKTVTINKKSLKNGDVVKDDKETGDYKVKDVTKKEVTYQKPANKKLATISVPATVKIGGVTYKVTSIADNALANNKKITKVTIGSNVKTIGKKAFYKCTSLKKITIPSKVKKIGKQIFYGCKKLKTITIKTTKLTSKNVGSKAFKGIYSKATIKVPKSKMKSYKKILKAKGVSSKAKIKK